MRTNKSIKNAIIAVITNIVTMLVGMVAQSIFVKTLGKEYLGVNSLFSNIIYMLSIVELGMGTAIIYNLYKPVAENNKEEIKSLLKFYKKAYNIIACIILLIGVCIIPILNNIVGEVNIQENIYIIFILFLLDTVFSYLLTYKRSILYATQNTYIVNIVHIFYVIFMNAVSILILLFIGNYYIYLFSKIIFRVLGNIVINIIASKMYPYIKSKDAKKLDDTIVKNIIKKIKALFFHKIGEIMLLGTDSIIISKFLGVVWVGLYSNYNMIINSISGIFGQVFSAIIASVGNLLVEEKEEKIYIVYKRMALLNFWLSTFCTISIFCLMEPFILLWLGEEYLLSTNVLFVLVIVFYMQAMKKALKVFKEGAGKFEKDRYVPIIESLVNIVFSILLVQFFGISGIFMGTFLSTLVLYFYSFPKMVYKEIFHKSYREYALEYIKYALIMLFTMFITYGFTFIVKVENQLLQLIFNAAICIIIPNTILYFIYRKTNEFDYYKSMVKNTLKNRR